MKITFNELENKYYEGLEKARTLINKNMKALEQCALFLMEAAKLLNLYKENSFTQKEARAFVRAIDSMIDNINELSEVKA